MGLKELSVPTDPLKINNAVVAHIMTVKGEDLDFKIKNVSPRKLGCVKITEYDENGVIIMHLVASHCKRNPEIMHPVCLIEFSNCLYILRDELFKRNVDTVYIPKKTFQLHGVKYSLAKKIIRHVFKDYDIMVLIY